MPILDQVLGQASSQKVLSSQYQKYETIASKVADQRFIHPDNLGGIR